jgi:tetratricopeptide (TPR) repeat protein
MFYSRANEFIQRTFIAVSILATWVDVTTADEPQANSQKPQYERLLKGDDAKLADELGKKIVEAEKSQKYDDAIELSERMLALRTNVQGADHWETVNERWNLDAHRTLCNLPAESRAGWQKAIQGADKSQELEKQGQYTKAEPHWRQYCDACLQLFGKKHPRTITAYNNLASNLDDQGKYAEANTIYENVLDLHRELFGGHHPDTATSYCNLAVNLYSQGRYADAQPLYQTALALRRELLGERHLDTATCYNNLAANLAAQGKYADAQPLYQKVLSLRRELLGERHPSTATSYNNLAANLNDQGNYADAQTLYQKALDLNRELLGEQHPSTATSYNNLAANLDDQGNYADAQPLLQKSLELRRELLGERHPSTATSYNNLAFNLDAQGRYADAQPLYQQALNICREFLGEQHPKTALAYNNLALNLAHQGKYTDAQPLYEKAVNLYRELLGEKHPDTALTYNNLAGNLNAQGKYTEAQLLYYKSRDLFRELLGEQHPLTAMSFNSLAFNLDALGKYVDAQALYQKALEVRRERLGEQHPDTAVSYNNLAFNLNAQGKFGDARPFVTRAASSYEAARLNFGIRGLDRAVFGGNFSPYALLAATEARLQNPVGAWQAAEKNLARGLGDEIAASRKTAFTKEERTRRVDLASRLNALQPEVLRLVSQKDPTDDERKALARIQAERTTLETELTDLAVRLSQREVAPLSEVQGSIPAFAALIVWIDVSDQAGRAHEHWGCVVRHTGVPQWERLPGTGTGGQWTDDDDSLPAQLRAALVPAKSARADADDLVRELYAQRLAPLSKHLDGIKTLYVASVNQMAGIPIEVLTDDYTISYVPSGAFLARLCERESTDSEGLLALGDAVFTRPDAKSKPKSSTDLPESGVLITQVAPDGTAAKAQLKRGDVLVRYGDTNLNSLEQLTAAIQELATAKDPPKEIPVTVWREGDAELIICHLPPGRLGVGLSKEPVREAIASRRRSDAMLAQLHGGNWHELPGTRAEITQIANLFGDQATTRLDSAASEQSLEELRTKGDLSKFRYLHFATHGETNDVRAFESALILAQDKLPKDPLPRAGEPFINGQLAANEVLEFWDLNAELVTLSACETALGRKGGGDGLLGFAQAFLKAGSRAVCLSLWKVDDTATALLMTRFYQNLLGKRPGLDNPMPKAQALAEAKKWLRELSLEEAKRLAAGMVQNVKRQDRGKGEPLNLVVPAVDPAAPDERAGKPFAHPRYWSAFILIGDPN